MGINIHGEWHPIAEVLSTMEEFIAKNGGYREGALPASDFFYKVAEDFGAIIDEFWVTVYNEYYSDSGYNPSQEFDAAVQRYYFPEIDWNENWETDFDLPYRSFGDGANADDILETHFEDEFGYEGKFGYE